MSATDAVFLMGNLALILHALNSLAYSVRALRRPDSTRYDGVLLCVLTLSVMVIALGVARFLWWQVDALDGDEYGTISSVIAFTFLGAQLGGLAGLHVRGGRLV